MVQCSGNTIQQKQFPAWRAFVKVIRKAVQYGRLTYDGVAIHSTSSAAAIF
jgi:hypothetical protein